MIKVTLCPEMHNKHSGLVLDLQVLPLKGERIFIDDMIYNVTHSSHVLRNPLLSTKETHEVYLYLTSGIKNLETVEQ